LVETGGRRIADKLGGLSEPEEEVFLPGIFSRALR